MGHWRVQCLGSVLSHTHTSNVPAMYDETAHRIPRESGQNGMSKNLGKMAFLIWPKGPSGRTPPKRTLKNTWEMDIFQVDSDRKNLGKMKSARKVAPLWAVCPIFYRTKWGCALFRCRSIINIIKKRDPKSAHPHFAWKFPVRTRRRCSLLGSTRDFTL